MNKERFLNKLFNILSSFHLVQIRLADLSTIVNRIRGDFVFHSSLWWWKMSVVFLNGVNVGNSRRDLSKWRSFRSVREYSIIRLRHGQISAEDVCRPRGLWVLLQDLELWVQFSLTISPETLSSDFFDVNYASWKTLTWLLLNEVLFRVRRKKIVNRQQGSTGNISKTMLFRRGHKWVVRQSRGCICWISVRVVMCSVVVTTFKPRLIILSFCAIFPLVRCEREFCH